MKTFAALLLALSLLSLAACSSSVKVRGEVQNGVSVEHHS